MNLSGIMTALCTLVILFALSSVLDGIIKPAIQSQTDTLVRVPLVGVDILLGIPTDSIQWIIKLFVYAGIGSIIIYAS